MHLIAHFKTVTEHRRLVRRYCFRLGLYRQGLTHDLSKYSITEFRRGAKYYQGYRSPNDAERMEIGVSIAWLHHKGRNPHHFEYWIDYYPAQDGSVCFGGLEMPIRYIAEMFCDRVAACHIYLGDNYHDGAPYEYYCKSKNRIMIHPKTGAELEEMLRVLKDEGEVAAFQYVRLRMKECPSTY